MNFLRRRMLHQLRSRHNPLTRIALIITLLAITTAAVSAVSELEEIRAISESDKAMIAELILVVEGKAKIVERTGKYAVEYEMKQTTYEVK